MIEAYPSYTSKSLEDMLSCCNVTVSTCMYRTWHIPIHAISCYTLGELSRLRLWEHPSIHLTYFSLLTQLLVMVSIPCPPLPPPPRPWGQWQERWRPSHCAAGRAAGSGASGGTSCWGWKQLGICAAIWPVSSDKGARIFCLFCNASVVDGGNAQLQ